MKKNILIETPGQIQIRNGSFTGPICSPQPFDIMDIQLMLYNGVVIYEMVYGEKIKLSLSNYKKLYNVEDYTTPLIIDNEPAVLPVTDKIQPETIKKEEIIEEKKQQHPTFANMKKSKKEHKGNR